MNTIVESGPIRLEIEPEHGRIVGLRHTGLEIDLVAEPRLAENFRLLVPLPHRRGHYVRGADQRLTGVEIEPDGCRLSWSGLRTPECELDIDVVSTIRLRGDDLEARIELVNRSAYEIEEVFGLVLGGMGDRAERADWRIHFAGGGGKGEEWRCYETFPGSYLGPRRPVWSRMYPGGLAMPWVDLYNARSGKGVYLGNHDPGVRQSVLWSELTPWTTYGGPNGDGQYWPDPAASDEPVGMALSWNQLPFVAPGEEWQGPPTVLHFHEGTWWEAARYYRSWFDARIDPDQRVSERSWLTDEDAWQSTIISYPDGTIGFRFCDLPEMARRAREVGINVLQLDGWDIGGIDRDYPDYRPDPRLGTVEDLRTALAECRALGVHVLLFSNLQWVSIDTEWYRDELHRYAVRDPRGNVRNAMGWEYNTTLGLMGQTIHQMVMANPSRPEFRHIILDQFDQIVRLGPDGTQIDKLGALGQLDYAPDSPGPRAEAIPAGALDVLRELHRSAREHEPDFAIATEMHWDRAMPYVDASYSRFFTMDHLPTFAAAFPEYRQSCCITGDLDFGLVNNCLRFGHVVNVEALCLHGTVADVPRLRRYVAEALRVRRSLLDRIWDSRLVDPARAGVRASNSAIRYALHESIASGRYALVLDHFDDEAYDVEIPPFAGATSGTVYRPFADSRHLDLPGTVEIPPHEFVVVTYD